MPAVDFSTSATFPDYLYYTDIRNCTGISAQQIYNAYNNSIHLYQVKVTKAQLDGWKAEGTVPVADLDRMANQTLDITQ